MQIELLEVWNGFEQYSIGAFDENISLKAAAKFPW